MFSPWYAWARRRGPADPLNHVGLNVALYGRPRGWALTDRRSGAATCTATSLTLGPSTLAWDGTALTVEITETAAPIPRPLRGRVRLHPAALGDTAFTLDAAGRHRWRPIAPRSWAEVELTSPALRWAGPAYFDTNAGDAPLERDFVDWDWCRAPHGDGAAVLYDARRRDGTRQALALRMAADGTIEQRPPPPEHALRPTRLWRMPRPTRAEATPRVVRTLEDTPFYSRSAIATRVWGEDVTAVHESLSLDRFRLLAVQAMLPFRVPRALR